MLSSIIKYSLKIWLTSVMVAPLSFLMIEFIQEYPPRQDIVELFSSGITVYAALMLFHLIFSAITWFVFTAVIGLVVLIPANTGLKTCIIFIAGVLLTAGTFFATILPINAYQLMQDKELIILMACNCLCIGGGVWFYKLKLPQPDPIVENKEII
jgi:hypothetical protein